MVSVITSPNGKISSTRVLNILTTCTILAVWAVNNAVNGAYTPLGEWEATVIMVSNGSKLAHAWVEKKRQE